MKTIKSQAVLTKEKAVDFFPAVFQYVVNNLDPSSNYRRLGEKMYEFMLRKFQRAIFNTETRLDPLVVAVDSGDLETAQKLFFSLLSYPDTIANLPEYRQWVKKKKAEMFNEGEPAPVGGSKHYGSEYEFIVSDIFILCNIDGGYYNRDVTRDDGKLTELFGDLSPEDLGIIGENYRTALMGHAETFFADSKFRNTYARKMPEPDFYVNKDGGTVFFEVFGYSGELYALKKQFKKKYFGRYFNLAFIDVETKDYSLLNFANILDTQVCYVDKESGDVNCNMALTDGNILTHLKSIPLLSDEGINFCKHYVNQVRAAYVMSKSKSGLFTFAATEDMISIEQMVQELSNQYDSADLWPDEEVVAIYFRDIENILPYLDLEEQEEPEPQLELVEPDVLDAPEELPLAASTWYKALKK